MAKDDDEKPKRKRGPNRTREGTPARTKGNLNMPAPPHGLGIPMPSAPNTLYAQEITTLMNMGLSKQHALFVVYYVATGNAAQSSAAAGFSVHNGKWLMAKPLIAEAIHTLFNFRIRTVGPVATQLMLTIMQDEKAENKDRIAAAKLLFEQAKNPAIQNAMPVASRDAVEGIKELREQITDLSRNLGLAGRDVTPKLIATKPEEVK